jgi:hypothetical protein
MVIALKTTRRFSSQFLRHALADGPAFDQHGPVERLDRHVPPIAGDAFGPVLDARRRRVPGARVPGRQDGGDGRSVDQYASGHDQILVDGSVAIVEAVGVPGKQHQLLGGREFRDDGPPLLLLGIERPSSPPTVGVQGGGQARRHQEQTEGDDPSGEVTH